MFYRLLFSFLWMLICTSCTSGFFSKSNTDQALDTIIDFTKVDVSPSFNVCKRLLDKAKTDCFRINIQKFFIKRLQELNLIADNRIDETVYVVLTVNEKGRVSLKELVLSDAMLSHFPTIDLSIKEMVMDLPKLSPALKRGIPVNTEYKLPIHIIVE